MLNCIQLLKVSLSKMELSFAKMLVLFAEISSTFSEMAVLFSFFHFLLFVRYSRLIWLFFFICFRQKKELKQTFV
ncbi:hypothetical protein CYJ36_21555 [Bacillus sp. UMB0893]|nr:hypothetical protein CYJ36_21555 [Bacillus sp. UMB0893]